MTEKDKPVIQAFDFDGTLTTKDSLVELICYAKGTAGLVWGLLKYSPVLLLMKAGLYGNGKAKQKLFSHFFKGMTEVEFNTLCRRFAADNKNLLRPKGTEKIQETLQKGDKVIIITASIENWVAPFFDENNIEIIGTQIEISQGELTGRFLTPNCHGEEKVRRLLEKHPDRQAYRLIAYGDSNGDKPLLDFADEQHYKPFC